MEFRAPVEVALEAGHDDIVAIVAEIIVEAIQRPLAAVAHDVVEDAHVEAAVVAEETALAQEGDDIAERGRRRGVIDTLFLVLVFVGAQFGANLLLHVGRLRAKTTTTCPSIHCGQLPLRGNGCRPSRQLRHLPHLGVS